MSELIGLHAQLACIWEATARKPGNVHRYADFVDTHYLDFLVSAAAIAPVLAEAPPRRVGETVLEAVRRRKLVHAGNTNLGIVLLLAPLAKASVEGDLQPSLNRVLDGLDVEDAREVYAAIRLAAPGGLGKVEAQDVSEEPTQTLREVMALASDRDLVARQYAGGFREVFEEGTPALSEGLERTGCLEGAIVWCHLTLMANRPDSLIARKRGRAEAEEASRLARLALAADWPGGTALAELDAWLRAEGHARNPGTTADLVTASLYVALRRGIIPLPPPFPWSCGPTP